MSDEATPAAPAAPEAPAADAPASPEANAALSAAENQARTEPTKAPEAPADDDFDIDAEPADDLFSDPEKAKAIVAKARKEAAKYRSKAKEANDAFAGWHPEDAAYIKGVIAEAVADPKVGATKMREIADLLDKGDAAGAATVAVEATEESKGLTEDDVNERIQKALGDRDQEADIKRRSDEIIAKAKDLGYDPADENKVDDYFTLIHIAKTQTNGDLDKAAERLEARNQRIVDSYIQEKAKDAAGTPRHAGRGEAPVVDGLPANVDFKTAGERARARIAAASKQA